MLVARSPAQTKSTRNAPDTSPACSCNVQQLLLMQRNRVACNLSNAVSISMQHLGHPGPQAADEYTCQKLRKHLNATILTALDT